MGTDIARQNDTTGRPSILSRAVQDRIGSTFNRLTAIGGGRHEIPAELAPTPNERQALAGRSRDLQGWLVPAETVRIRTMVAALLAGYPSGRAHKDNPDKVLDMFVRALQDVPGWAVAAACAAWNRGDYPGKREGYSPAPSPADLRELALAESKVAREEKTKIDAIIKAEVVEEVSPEARERIAAGLKALAARIGSGTDAEEEARQKALAAEMREKTAANRQAEQRLAGFDDGLDMSVSLRKDIAAWRERRAHDDIEIAAYEARQGQKVDGE
jgi:hypothetical protein